jgi:beta-lactamase regulating signal transducer with metallopeptidase domain
MTAWLLDTLIYTGLMIALVLVLRRPVSHHFGPQIAYMLWGLPFLRLLLPPVVLPASLAPEPAAVPMIDTAPAAGTFYRVEVVTTTSPVMPAEIPLTASAAPAASTLPAWEWSDLGAAALWLWLASAVVFLGWRVVMYRRMRAELLVDARPVGEIGKVRLVETPALNAPVAFGVLDKVIALPPLFMAQPDTVARDLAIQHELHHHRGNDLLANMAAQVLLALHWFNPLAWYGWRAMRRDQEAACDARVLHGRCRDERVLYAALIVDIAAGPRLALAAPMACPVLGDKSVIHRLKSMAMSDVTPGRRWLGRGLIVTAASLALPLTASISYSVANAQAPETLEPSEAPVAPITPVDPSAPAAPATPDAAPAPHSVRTFTLRREGEDGKPVVQHFTFERNGPNPAPNVPMPEMPRMEFHAWGDPDDPDFAKNMEAWGQQMEKWGKEYGEQWEKWGEQQGAERSAQELAWSEQARRNAPEVVHSCDQAEMARTTTEDGRRRVVLCPQVNVRMAEQAEARAAQAEARAQAQSLAALRRSRNAIATNRGMSEDVRQEVLEDLDDEIRRMERGQD